MTPPGRGAAGPGSSRRRSAGRAADDEPLITIGELLARLAPEFPDVSHSKVRFLEDRGLVSPRRTPSGYRQFAPADVERLRAVLTLQRDQYLPLRVIREHLAAVDAGHGQPLPAPRPTAVDPVVEPAVDPAPGGPSEALAEPVDEPADEPLDDVLPRPEAAARRPSASRAQVLDEAGGSLALVEALEDHGLLPRAVAGHYPAPALDLVRAARVLAEHGVEPRHLRALRSAVGHEAALVQQVVTPLRRQRPSEAPSGASGSGDAGDHAQRVGGELVASMLALHAAALGCAVDDVLPSS